MQSDLFIEVLVLQSEQLMRILVNPFILFQTAPGGVFAEPQELAVLIGHLTWDDDLVAVEVVSLLAAFAVFIGPVVYLCQGFVAVVLPSPQPSPTKEGVDVGMKKVHPTLL